MLTKQGFIRFGLLLGGTIAALCACQPQPNPVDSADRPAEIEARKPETRELGVMISERADRLLAVIGADDRSTEDRQSDAFRRPILVIEFLDFDVGMTVLDVYAGDGYFSEILAAAVGPTGRVFAQNDPAILTREDGATEKALAQRLAGGRWPNISRLDATLTDTHTNKQLSGTMDAAVMFLTLHDTINFHGEQAAIDQLESVYSLLKPGATLGVSDHVGDSSLPETLKDLHRADKATVERLIRTAGFEIELVSDLFANPDDDHTLNVFANAIRGQTDRFLIRARKPK